MSRALRCNSYIEAAEWLETLSRETSADHRRHWAIASHWLEANDAERARRSLDSAADVLLANGFARHAAEMLERAAEIAGTTETALRYLQRSAEMCYLDDDLDVETAMRRLNDRYNEVGTLVHGERFTAHHDVESMRISVAVRDDRIHNQMAIAWYLHCVLAENAPAEHRLVAAVRILVRYAVVDMDRDVTMRAWQVVEQVVPTTSRERYFFERCAALYQSRVMSDPARGLEHARRAEAMLDPSNPADARELHFLRSGMADDYELLGDLDSAMSVRHQRLAIAQRLRSAWMTRGAVADLIGAAAEAGRFEEARQFLPLVTRATMLSDNRYARAQEICLVVLALEDGDAVRARAELVTPLSAADEPIGAMQQARVLAMYAHLALLEDDDATIRCLLPRLLDRFAARSAYMEHPAYVAGICLVRVEGPAAAAAFVSEYLRDRRVEQWTPRAELLALARGEEVTLVRATNGVAVRRNDAALPHARS